MVKYFKRSIAKEEFKPFYVISKPNYEWLISKDGDYSGYSADSEDYKFYNKLDAEKVLNSVIPDLIEESNFDDDNEVTEQDIRNEYTIQYIDNEQKAQEFEDSFNNI